MTNKRGMGTWIWILIIAILISVGVGIYFWLSGDVASVNPLNSVPSPPALPD